MLRLNDNFYLPYSTRCFLPHIRNEPAYLDMLPIFFLLLEKIVFLLMSVMIFLGPLFTWTDVSEPTIHGIQGRYFLPGLALVMLCFGSEEQMITHRQMRLLYLQNIMLVFVIQSVLYITVNR